MTDPQVSLSSENDAPNAALVRLLSLQDQDIVIDQLAHHRDHLAEQARIAELDAQRHSLVTKAAANERQRTELLGRQAGLEEEINEALSRIKTIESNLSGGSASSYRDQSAMASEIDTLRARQHQLEDEELEIMEQLEPVTAVHEEFEDTCKAIDAEVVSLQATVAELQAAIDGELVTERERRAELAAPVPAPLLAEYEALRAHLGGVGAARLVHRTCSGCHLSLSATEADQIQKAPSGTMFHCEQCGRILIPA